MGGRKQEKEKQVCILHLLAAMKLSKVLAEEWTDLHTQYNTSFKRIAGKH